MSTKSNDEKLLWTTASGKGYATASVCRLVASCAGTILLSSTFLSGSSSSSSTDYNYISSASILVIILSCMILYGCQSCRYSYRLWGYTNWSVKTPPHPRMYYRRTIVKTGYEAVEDAFVKLLQAGRETNMQFAAFIKGELVVDLAGSLYDRSSSSSEGSKKDTSFDSDHYSCIWSSSKVVTSILMAWLVDKGYLDYNAKIKDYWPEFIGGGKDDITVGQLLMHKAGLQEPTPYKVQQHDLLSENIQKGNMSKIIQDWECKFPKDTNEFTYHAITRGWILNEIARRVDPKKRTLGMILKEEFAKPLNIDKECFLGIPKDLNDPTLNSKLHMNDFPPSMSWILCNKLCQLLGIPVDFRWEFPLLPTFFILVIPYWTATKSYVNPKRLNFHDFASQPTMLQGESPSGNIHSSARALATIANTLCNYNNNGNNKNNPEIFSHKNKTALHEKMLQNEETKKMFGENVTFSNGGLAIVSKDKSTIFPIAGSTYGWAWGGYNGSLILFHPNGDFALAFQPTAFNELDSSTRIGTVIKALMSCARNIHGNDFGQEK